MLFVSHSGDSGIISSVAFSNLSSKYWPTFGKVPSQRITSLGFHCAFLKSQCMTLMTCGWLRGTSEPKLIFLKRWGTEAQTEAGWELSHGRHRQDLCRNFTMLSHWLLSATPESWVIKILFLSFSRGENGGRITASLRERVLEHDRSWYRFSLCP